MVGADLANLANEAAILAGRTDVFVFSIHGEKNFPFRKVASSLDIALPDGTQDDAYLHRLHEALDAVLGFRPDLVLYQAGVDPLEHDRLGRLALTYEGLMARDRLVFETFAKAGIPLSLGIGGGFIAEELVEGPEVTVNALSIDGVFHPVGPGSWYRIPARTPHATLADPGERMSLVCFFPHDDFAHNIEELEVSLESAKEEG